MIPSSRTSSTVTAGRYTTSVEGRKHTLDKRLSNTLLLDVQNRSCVSDIDRYLRAIINIASTVLASNPLEFSMDLSALSRQSIGSRICFETA